MTNRLLSIVVFFFVCGPMIFAGSWEAFFRGLIDTNTGSDVIESGKLYEGSLYSAKMQFIITDQDGNSNNFKGPDLIDFQILGNHLEFQGTKDELVHWAEKNGQKIYNAMFPNDFGSAVAGGTDAQFNQGVSFANILLRNLRTENTNNFIARMEFSFGELGEKEERVFSFLGVPSYNINFGEKLEHSVGFMVPIRYTVLDDSMNSELFSFGFNPYLRYNIFQKGSFLLEEDRFLVDVGINPFLGATFVSGDILGGIGNVSYGGGFFTAAEWNISDRLKIRAGLSYQISKAYLPSSAASDDFAWIVDVINDLPISHELSVGFNVTVSVFENFTVALDYFRTHSLGSGVDSADVAVSNIAVIFNYFLLDFVDLSLGYKTRLEIQDLTEHSLLIGGMVRF